MKKVWIVFVWQDAGYGAWFKYVWKVCSTEEKAREYANQDSKNTDVEEYEVDEVDE